MSFSVPTPNGEEKVMPLNGISKYVRPETRRLIHAALGDAWRERKKSGLVDATLARRKLARTIVALASAGETDAAKLKWFALHATKGALQAEAARARQEVSQGEVCSPW